MSVTNATRTLAGVELPAPGTWVIDGSHSSLEAVARHLMVSKVRGRFGSFEGTIHVDEIPENSTVDVTIDASSIDTRESKRDEHLRSADFLDVESFPTITFHSTSAKQTGKNRLRVHGDLTVRGVTRPVDLDVEYTGIVQDPWGNTKAGFSATAELDREAFGMTWNAALETGGVLVGKTLKIEIEIEAAAGGMGE